MCGIFGAVGLEVGQDRIDIVAHRGPDGRGWREYGCPAGPVVLGHRRLAIIDVSDAGLQPMVSPTGRYHLVFNGEIYNYLELRNDLRALGEVFITESDSEVLLRAWTAWGEACLPKLRGMFAFLIWDDREKRLFAARDRFGIKPLYFAPSPRGIAFGSEIKQLLGLPGVTGRMNLPRVHDFLANGVIDHTGETLFEGVSQLRAGECITIETGGGVPAGQPHRWYPVETGALNLTEAEAAARFRALLTDAVRLHLRSDVPVGSCLSGGLDSSSIVCLMAAMLRHNSDGGRVNTVSACYDDKSVDERPFMEAVVAAADARPHYIYPRAEDVFALASDITWHQDEPFGSTSVFAQWCVFQEARRTGVKVMLDGQGADEQLAGYHHGFPLYLATLARRGRFAAVAQAMAERRRWHGLPLRQQIPRALVPLLPEWLGELLRRQHQGLIRHDWLGSALVRERGNPRGAMALAGDLLCLPPVRDLRTLCLSQTFASNLQMLLHWEDRNSMAHSIEARVPFLDHPLVEFDLALGNAHKMAGGDTKRVLREGMSGILPETVRQRRDKLGFSTPEQAWFRGPLRPMIQDGVEAVLARWPDLLNSAGTRALCADMLDRRQAIDFTLWRIVNLGIWGERFSVSL